MPAPGDQHTSWENPFEEAKPRVSGWTAKEIATIASKLDKQLGPEYISSRSGPGGSRVHYLTAEKVIGLANEVFGFNGWSSSIQNIQVDFADENPQTQRVSIGLSVIVRVTLRDGTYHEDIGYGSIENAKGKAMAFEKAKKEGTTDGLKRALRSFGNVLGNCIYDADYVKQVTKVKAQPVKKFDQDNLHRHSDFVKKDASMSGTPVTAGPIKNTTRPATVKVEATESFEDFLGVELDEADFCVPGEGHPDEIVVHQPGPVRAQVQHSKPPSKEPGQVQAQAQGPSRPTTRAISGGSGNRAPQTPNSGGNVPSGGTVRDSPQMNNMPAPPMPPPAAETAMFFSARSISRNTDAREQGLASSHAFNPKAESPSIRKTPGIDHTSSKPVSRTGQHVPPANSQSGAPSSSATGFTPVRPGGPATRGNLVNPSLDQARRIGAPGGPGSPLANRGSYKPPTMKRPLPGETGAARAPLIDLPANTSAQGNGTNAAATTGGAGLDAKRQKTG
ncbi:DNA repair and recombination protein rhm52, partial [Metarhizium hybridum]